MTKIKSKILFLFLLILFGFINQQKVYSCSEYYVGEAYFTETCSSYCRRKTQKKMNKGKNLQQLETQLELQMESLFKLKQILQQKAL